MLPLRDTVEHVVANDHAAHTARANVLLRTSVNDRVLIDIKRLRENVRGSFANYWQAVGIELIFKFDALDRLVRRVVHVGRFTSESQLAIKWHRPKAFVIS